MKRVLALQHAGECPTGALGEILQEYQIVCESVNVETEALPDPTLYDALLSLGGPQHVYHEEEHPYFAQEKQLIRTIVAQNIPFLGICLGGQLLASALGGIVRGHTIPEIGFFAVQLTEAGKDDPLFVGLPGYQKVFHWHSDTFDVPSGGILLATSPATGNQAFRYGRCAYGLQYHIELNVELLDLWLGHPEYKEEIIRTIGIEEYKDINVTRSDHYPTYRSHTRIMFENFLRMGGLIGSK